MSWPPMYEAFIIGFLGASSNQHIKGNGIIFELLIFVLNATHAEY